MSYVLEPEAVHSTIQRLSQRDRAMLVSLNISLSHSMSLKVIRNDALEEGVCKSLLVFHCNYVCNYVSENNSASNNDVTLKSGLAGRWFKVTEMVPFKSLCRSTVFYSHSIVS